ncbi:M23 family metallopeptidase [Paraburkholderia nodosa]|uniref:M23 family metallopeptidase n=1 Tax=Paraburkholderia nodosa TaxID=392320 RepID=UPI000489DCF6|nr:M23 family metallopeptidase [Paraburkholderia nodosa]
MIISPPFLPESGLTSSDGSKPDPMMDAVDKFELAHGIYPIAFDRRWHCGVHLAPNDHGPVQAIADGEVVAYRVCQHAMDSGNGNAGFVLLKHSTETGEGRTLTFYSLYMHLLPLAEYQSFGHDGTRLPEFLRKPSGPDTQGQVTPAVAGGGNKVRRKDVIGFLGRYEGVVYMHFEIFMTPGDFDAYFSHTQLGIAAPTTPTASDCWGHTYYTIPKEQSFLALPPQTGADHKLHGIAFDPGQVGTNALSLAVETYFSTGTKYTNVWSVADDGTRTLLTREPVPEADYEYDLYKRATALYSACPSDGYEMLRFGRVLSSNATQTTWVKVTYAAGKQGYIDISKPEIRRLSDADFPSFMGWKKLCDESTPFSSDGLCDINALGKLVNDVADSGRLTNAAETTEVQKADALSGYVKGHDSVRQALRGFICNAPSEWDSTNNQTRYAKLLDEDGFYNGNEDGYKEFLKYLMEIQFWDTTGLPAGQKLWFFHPLAFIRHFRKCGWLSADELAQCLPRVSISANLSWNTAYERAKTHHKFINLVYRKYLHANQPRLVHFLAQTYIETGVLRTMMEDSLGHGHAYGPFYGRGYLQLTWPVNYEKYKKFRCIATHGAGSYADPRITFTSTHVWADGDSAKRWSPLYDPQVVATDLAHAAESSGMFWVSKTFRHTHNMNRAADFGVSPLVVGFISWLVNGGGAGYVNRQQFAALLERVLLDTVGRPSHEVLAYPPLLPASSPVLCRTFPPTTVPFSQTVSFDYVPQTP